MTFPVNSKSYSITSFSRVCILFDFITNIQRDLDIRYNLVGPDSKNKGSNT